MGNSVKEILKLVATEVEKLKDRGIILFEGKKYLYSYHGHEAIYKLYLASIGESSDIVTKEDMMKASAKLIREEELNGQNLDLKYFLTNSNEADNYKLYTYSNGKKDTEGEFGILEASACLLTAREDGFKEVLDIYSVNLSELVLKLYPNNTSVKEACSVCGDTMKNNMPLGLFVRDTYNSVCEECGEEHSPELIKQKHEFYENSEDIENWIEKNKEACLNHKWEPTSKVDYSGYCVHCGKLCGI